MNSFAINAIKERVASDSVKVVSFDIFDTLLSRPCLIPYNLFRVMGKRGGIVGDYETLRRNAEHFARKVRTKGTDDITFEDIFKRLDAELGRDYSSRLKEIEVQTEGEYLYPRRAVSEIFHYAFSLGKRVLIVSDMYLPESVLGDILKKNGYAGYHRLYVSCEYLMSKDTKRLFGRVIEDCEAEGISAGEILHIGDNPKADLLHSGECGMQSVFVESGTAALKKSERFSFLTQDKNIGENHFLLGLIANRYFDFLIETRSEEELARRFLCDGVDGTVLAFVKDILNEGDGVYADLLGLIASDGFLPKKFSNSL